MLYRQEATTPSILGPPLIKVDASANPEAHVKDLNNWIIDIQATSVRNSFPDYLSNITEGLESISTQSQNNNIFSSILPPKLVENTTQTLVSKHEENVSLKTANSFDLLFYDWPIQFDFEVKNQFESKKVNDRTANVTYRSLSDWLNPVTCLINNPLFMVKGKAPHI
ncbi:hypothetical protein DSO57_1011351, partial [Entomophthora muscae]